MFPRIKKSGNYEYVQIVENRREAGATRQRVIASLGRADTLLESGELAGLTQGLARMCEEVRVLNAQRSGGIEAKAARKLGPGLVFEKLWHALGIDEVLTELLSSRRFSFPVERALFLTALHRLFEAGSDRQAERWREDYVLDGVDALELHHLYRAMAWLGEELPKEEQAGATPFAPRCVKDLIEEALFTRRQDLFSALDMVFFDTTSIYFEGEGGETLGKHGNSKGHRPDLKQMVVGAVLDERGRPVCCELWPGNTTDVKTLLPIVERLRARFHIGTVCIVADRGMISKDTMKELAATDGVDYILGVRMRATKEAREEVLGQEGDFEEIHPKSPDPKAPAPLKVKEVRIGERRYIVCHNEDQAKKDAADRQAILKSLEDQLKRGDKELVGNKGYRKFLKKPPEAHFEVDYEKARTEARYDGKWVLRTSTSLPAAQVALKYKQLWMVEDFFRSTKSILDTRPIFHKCDETIRGHVFCSFLALMLLAELNGRLDQKDRHYEWNDIKRDLEALQVMELDVDGKTYWLRTELRGVCSDVLRAAKVAPPPSLRQ